MIVLQRFVVFQRLACRNLLTFSSRECRSFPRLCSNPSLSKSNFSLRKVVPLGRLPSVLSQTWFPSHSQWISSVRQTRLFTNGGGGGKSVWERFKEAYRENGKVLIVTHIITSVMWFGLFYGTAISCHDAIGMLKKFGLSEERVQWLQSSKYINVAVAYLLYEIFKPVRYLFTILCTRYVVLYLRKAGKISKDTLSGVTKEAMNDPNVRRQWKSRMTRLEDQLKKNKNVQNFRNLSRTKGLAFRKRLNNSRLQHIVQNKNFVEGRRHAMKFYAKCMAMGKRLRVQVANSKLAHQARSNKYVVRAMNSKSGQKLRNNISKGRKILSDMSKPK